MADTIEEQQGTKEEPAQAPVQPHSTLAKALVAAQKDMPKVEPDGINPHFKSRFVTLGHLIAKARPVINKHGIAVAQFPSADAEGKPTLVTILMHESGETLQFDAPLFLSKNDPQGQGSAITYMRRYALASALGISDQEDDDGNAGSSPRPTSPEPEPDTITEAERDALYERFKATGLDGIKLKLRLTSLGVAGQSAKQGIGLLSPDTAAELDAWLGDFERQPPASETEATA